MNNEQLRSILAEYPLSLRLDVIVERERALETTVAEMICKLMDKPPGGLLTFCGRSECIIRERGERTDDVAGAAPYRKWLEMDMR